MSRYKPYIIFVVMMAAGFTLIIVVSQGYYPIALVHNTLISARTFSLEYHAASLYYQNMVKTYKPLLENDGELASIDLEAGALDQLIEDSLVRDGARLEVGSDLDNLVENKLSKYSDDVELEKAASVLYGLGKDNFWRMVLIPQATREVLAGRLFLRGEQIDDWLVSTKKSARVIIFSPQFKWDGEKIAVSK
ncbi:MAG: hypothetical protein Q7R94_02655 [bacterium]|nr:hypothetical protein [bacterium]